MKITSFGVAVLENDTHISRWVEEHKTIEIAKDWPIGLYKHLIPIGGVVVDAGAFIGDHTVTYSKLVGPGGTVVAFEVNKPAFECLVHNTKGLSNVVCFPSGLGDRAGFFAIDENANAGASSINTNEPPRAGAFGKIETLDQVSNGWSRLDFIKMDIEGFEVKALNGAMETIRRFRPAMFIEVNAGALEKAGNSREQLWTFLGAFGYACNIVPGTENYSSPQYDLLCLPPR